MKKFNKISVIVLAVLFSLGLTSPAITLAAGPSKINLGTSANFVILAKTGVSTTGTTSIVGDIGVSPAEATYITGFDLILPAASAFSTSSLITGKVYAPGYAVPTPSNISTSIGDMQTAYTDGMSRADGFTELGAGNIGGLTLAPGVYKWGTGVTIPTDVTLSGGSNDVWIFQIAQNLDISSNTNIVLKGGAQASNIFWIVAGQTTIGTGAEFNGNILDQTAIVLNTGATLNGRALAQTAVTLDANAVTIPSGSSSNSDSNYNSNSSADTSNSINAGASETSSPSVKLALSASNATEMLISNDAGFAGASWEAYSTSKNWTLTSGDGAKTVYAKFRDANGNTSSVVSDVITVSANGTITVAQGCSGGNIYNTSTGALCINNAVPQGCSGGNIYNISTGALCVNNSGSYNFGTATLKNGSKGEAVKELQRFLNAKLGLGLVVDGAFGPKTTVVIKKWQTTNGLVSDGLVGAKTKVKMNATN